jgi:hypothetical protein
VGARWAELHRKLHREQKLPLRLLKVLQQGHQG